MKKFILLFIVMISFSISWVTAYGAEIPQPKPSADMYNWESWSSDFNSATITIECNDGTDIWALKTTTDPVSWYCIQVGYKTVGVMSTFDSMREAPNCKCPPSSY